MSRSGFSVTGAPTHGLHSYHRDSVVTESCRLGQFYESQSRSRAVVSPVLLPPLTRPTRRDFLALDGETVNCESQRRAKE